MTTLLVASTGGHLKEMHHLYRRFSGVRGPFRWVTFDTAQSRSLLDGEPVDFVRFVGGRDPVNVIRNVSAACRILGDDTIDTVVSTGSAVAVPFFVLASARRLRCYFVESAARIDGPSLSGRLIGKIPGVGLYAQYPGWADRKWSYSGSVFDTFECTQTTGTNPDQLEKLVVTLGTYRGYGFPRLIRRLLKIIPPGADVLWQTGDTDVSALGVIGHYALPERDLTRAMSEADVVISHAGVGNALAALEVGKCPLLVPRRLSLGEHVDDHQIQVANELGSRGLAVVADADELGYDNLLSAAGRGVIRRADGCAFVMSNTLGDG